jgi:hypothetical protein
MHEHDDFQVPDEEWALARETMAMAEQLVRGASYLCLEPVAQPTTAQLLAVQAFFPHDDANDLRRDMLAGLVRIGPFLPGPVLDFALTSLRSAGLAWRGEAPNARDLAKLGFAPR